MGDIKSVVTLYVEAQEWNEAFTLAEKYPEYREQVTHTKCAKPACHYGLKKGKKGLCTLNFADLCTVC